MRHVLVSPGFRCVLRFLQCFVYADFSKRWSFVVKLVKTFLLTEVFWGVLARLHLLASVFTGKVQDLKWTYHAIFE